MRGHLDLNSTDRRAIYGSDYRAYESVVTKSVGEAFHRGQDGSLDAEWDARDEELGLTRSCCRQSQRIATALGVDVASPVQREGALDESLVVECRA